MLEGFAGRSLADPWSYIPICVFLYKDSTTIASQRDVGYFIECQSNPCLGFFRKTGICVLCGARQDTIAICSSRRYVHSLCRLSVCRTEVCVETTSVVDTHELLVAGWRDDARGHAPLCQSLVWRLQNRKLVARLVILVNYCHKLLIEPN